ncbi:hypothetical protein [Bradyrhizobium genosp. SA-3]|uniref:hypothetical protein n=1 Tax=Bradyrhizobium genosp. SA-3 TaxID=508868 RepID=UPI0013EE5E7E|nr:hypothetical protein [Bradyrhizobium genosp. SA-3]
MLGDARLMLTASPEHYYLIVLDAFSSDAIPVHLLTRESFAGYAHGVIVVHISNQHMSLWGPAAAVGSAEGLVAFGRDETPTNQRDDDMRTRAPVVVLAREVQDVRDLPAHPGWKRLDPNARTAWSMTTPTSSAPLSTGSSGADQASVGTTVRNRSRLPKALISFATA